MTTQPECKMSASACTRSMLGSFWLQVQITAHDDLYSLVNEFQL